MIALPAYTRKITNTYVIHDDQVLFRSLSYDENSLDIKFGCCPDDAEYRELHHAI